MALLPTSKAKVFLYRLKPFFASGADIGIHFQRFRDSPAGHKGRAHFSSNTGSPTGSGVVEFPKWRKLDSRSLGITMSMISLPSQAVLRVLRGAGFEAYLVGGCVRDILLNRVPKDFDVITAANLKEVKKMFRRAIIVGRRFPICRVPIKGSIVEVSSFETEAEQCGSMQIEIFKMAKSCGPRDYNLWRSSIRRDFTVNSLFFDPFRSAIFDYTNGMVDLRSLKLRTVIPAQSSFKEDEARILRGLRLAARLNLSFAKDTETAIYDLSSSVAGLNKSRINMEMHYMLAYGAAEPSLLLLKKFKLLEILLPFHGAYLFKQMDHGISLRSLMLMKLFSNLDQLISCDRPCTDSLWVAILVFHLALFGNPQPAVVVLTFASLLCRGRWKDSIKFARENSQTARVYMPEILDNFNNPSDDEIAKSVVNLAKNVRNSVDVLVNVDSLLEAMTRFPEFQCSGLVFVSQGLGRRAMQIFSILMKDVTSLKEQKRCPKINYRLLMEGDIPEIRFVLGKIILNSMICGTTSDGAVAYLGKDGNEVMGLVQAIPIESTHVKKDDSNGNDGGKQILSLIQSWRLLDNACDTITTLHGEKSTVDADRQKDMSSDSDLCNRDLPPDNTKKDIHLIHERKRTSAPLSTLFM